MGWKVCVQFPAQAIDFFLLQNDQNGSGSHPAFYSVDTGVLSPGIKQVGYAVDHSPPSSVEVKNEWS
jgi:hypothetical protein